MFPIPLAAQGLGDLTDKQNHRRPWAGLAAGLRREAWQGLDPGLAVSSYRRESQTYAGSSSGAQWNDADSVLGPEEDPAVCQGPLGGEEALSECLPQETGVC